MSVAMENPQGEQIGILGGSFDPIHLGHLRLGLEARQRFQLDQILFVPAHQSPHKPDQPITDAHHRLAMLKIALQNQPGVEISEIELKRRGLSYTAETLEALQMERPAAELSLILGADTFQHFGSWRNFSGILSMSHLLVAHRPGHAMPPAPEFLKEILGERSRDYRLLHTDKQQQVFENPTTKSKIAFFEIPPLAISASQIRQEVHRNPLIKNMLPPAVDQYIMTHHLYPLPSQ